MTRLFAILLLAGCGCAGARAQDPAPPALGEALDRIVAMLAPALKAEEIEPDRLLKWRVAVVPIARDAGQLTPFSHRLAAELTARLSALPDLTVIERGQVVHVLEEQTLAHSAAGDERTAAQLGRLVGADRLLLGSYHRGTGALALNLRLVDVETAVVLAAAQETTRPGEDDEAAPPLALDEDLRRSIAVDFLALGETRVDGAPRPITVTDGATLASGDHFQIHVTPHQDGHVYVFLAGASGRLVRLFPAQGQAALVAEGKAIQIPPPGPRPWFELDGQTGDETLYLIAWAGDVREGRELGQTLAQVATWSEAQQSPEMATSLQALAKAIEERVALRRVVRKHLQRPEPPAAEARELVARGGETIRLLPERAEGTGVLVRCLRFQHR